MNQAEALIEARNFAKAAYNDQLEKLSLERRNKLAEMRNRLAARGSLLSGGEARESSRIVAENITLRLKTKLELFLEGCELHFVLITPQITKEIIDELLELKGTLISGAIQGYVTNSPNKLIKANVYGPLLEGQIHFSANSIKTTIDRRRLKMKPDTQPMNVYHVYGHNPRWVTNSEDRSVNIVTISNEQVFTSLKQEIDSKIADTEERRDILEKLTRLQEAQESPTFLQRYTEFIAVAANHMGLIAPFIPALTEMLHKHL